MLVAMYKMDLMGIVEFSRLPTIQMIVCLSFSGDWQRFCTEMGGMRCS